MLCEANRTALNVVHIQVSKPFFQTLTNWIFSGHLYDPFNEFFVQLNPNVPHKKLGWDTPSADMGFVGVDEFGNFGESENSNTAYMLWEKKYIFNKEMLPAFVSEAFGKKVRLHTLHIRQIRSLFFIIQTRSSPPARASTLFDSAVTIASGRLRKVTFCMLAEVSYIHAVLVMPSLTSL